MTDVLQIDMANEKGEDAIFEITGLDGMTSHDNSYICQRSDLYFTKEIRKKQ